MPVKLFVSSENTVPIVCIRCNRSKDINVDRFKGQRNVRVKCPCGNTWEIQIEYRGHYRKKTELRGSYKIISKDKSPGDAGVMTVVDLSLTGLHMKFKDFPFSLDVGDILNVRFNLDDKNNSLVNRDVVVKNIHRPYVRVMFHRLYREDSTIGFYLFK